MSKHKLNKFFFKTKLGHFFILMICCTVAALGIKYYIKIDIRILPLLFGALVVSFAASASDKNNDLY